MPGLYFPGNNQFVKQRFVWYQYMKKWVVDKDSVSPGG